MNNQKVLEVIAIYRAYFEERNIHKIDFPHTLSLANYGDQAKEMALSHCHGMLDQMESFVAEGRMEKTFRWLGFIQGVLWLTGCYTLEELKNQNRPNSAT